MSENQIASVFGFNENDGCIYNALWSHYFKANSIACDFTICIQIGLMENVQEIGGILQSSSWVMAFTRTSKWLVSMNIVFLKPFKCVVAFYK